MLVNYIPRSAIIYTITNKPQANIDTEFKNKFNTLSWIQVIFSIWWYQVNFLISQLVFFDVKHLNLKKRHTDNRKGLFIFIMLLFPEAKALIIPLSVRTYRKEKTNASLQRILPVFTSRRFKTRPTLPGKDYKLFSVPPGFIPSDKSKLKYNPLMKNIVIKSTHCFFFLSIFFFSFTASFHRLTWLAFPRSAANDTTSFIVLDLAWLVDIFTSLIWDAPAVDGVHAPTYSY